MKIFGVLVVLGVAYYFYAMYAETRDVKELCATYVEGTSADDLLKVAEGYSGKLMGPIEDKNKDNTFSFIYCSSMTMCDVSCDIEVESGVVTKSEFHSR